MQLRIFYVTLAFLFHMSVPFNLFIIIKKGLKMTIKVSLHYKPTLTRSKPSYNIVNSNAAQHFLRHFGFLISYECAF